MCKEKIIIFVQKDVASPTIEVTQKKYMTIVVCLSTLFNITLLL